MAQAKALKEEYETKLREINKEAEEILGEARKKALANENKIVSEAKEEAARIIERAGVEAELERNKAADEVNANTAMIINTASLSSCISRSKSLGSIRRRSCGYRRYRTWCRSGYRGWSCCSGSGKKSGRQV